MDDGCCAVCAEALEWVAYGPCGHHDVCATCISRLRFVCNDRRCCICKSHSDAVFVTKALGSFTRIINDFSILPADARDGKLGSYWFHEGIQAYFDDFDEYKTIKAMCRLSCNVCDKLEVEGRKASKRRGRFKSVEQLKDHLSRQHELFFCSLCLESKKVFICEQKLYSRVQLRQHIRDGDSEVDGDETERCGFSGHPFCEFCQKPFYGDNELYFHLSTEHYTCHICQRQHQNQYQYYKDYDDLENHFCQSHFLCEDDSCLEKKFVVFASETDLKRHNALEHGGHMSRSKRSAALQLSTCFRYQGREVTHHVRPHVSARGVSENQLSSTTLANTERTSSNLPRHHASFSVQDVPNLRTTDGTSSTPDRPGQVEGASLDFRSVLLSGSDFPALPRTSKRRRRKSKKNSVGTSKSTIPTPVDSSNFRSDASLTVSQATNHPSSHSSARSNARSDLLLPTSNGICLASSENPTESTVSIKDVGSSSSSGTWVSVNGEPSVKGSSDLESSNKSVAERIRAALGFDKDKYAAFKIISKEYREGEIDAGEYLSYVHQFGLAPLILDLARLCPDPDKQKELEEIHKTRMGNVKENGQRKERGEKSGSKGSKKGKEKCEDTESDSKREAMPDCIMNHLMELKLNTRLQKNDKTSFLRGEKGGHSNRSGSTNAVETAVNESKNKLKKKSSKFLKARLGESSGSGVSGASHCDPTSYSMAGAPNQDSILASVRGVWRNGGGRRLVAMSQGSAWTR